ncbi:MAG: ABC transporter permease [Actinomycetota bacterium]|jgi:ABC-2 type transport system permease protein|nr:ABC transporter permease [Actinomycetota bacterium]
MMSLTYTRYEVLRTLRNRRFFVFSLIFPLVLFYVVAGENRHAHLDGASFPLYFMTGMIAFGTMTAVVAGGARIALERSLGWTRQMRITPLSVGAYFRAKLVTGYMMALISLVLISLAGLSLGVHLAAGHWAVLAGLVLVGIAPFAVLGILMGNLLSADSMGPAQGGVVTFFALLGGSFGRVFPFGTMHRLIELLPSYWLVQASTSAVGGTGWPLEGWVVIAVWSVGFAVLARLAYQRDTAAI